MPQRNGFLREDWGKDTFFLLNFAEAPVFEMP